MLNQEQNNLLVSLKENNLNLRQSLIELELEYETYQEYLNNTEFLSELNIINMLIDNEIVSVAKSKAINGDVQLLKYFLERGINEITIDNKIEIEFIDENTNIEKV